MKTNRTILEWIISIVAILFGLSTLRSGGGTLFFDGAIREASGNYVPFVVWSNFLLGFAYIAAGVGILKGCSWAKPLALGIAVLTVITFAAFGIHVLSDGLYEARTLKAMTVRSVVWIVIAYLTSKTARSDEQS